jgi:hypothetical protein
MTAAAVLARAKAAGLRLRLRPDGRVRVEADAPPPHDLLEELRRYRDELAALLAEREKRPGRETPPAAALGAVEVEAAPAPEAAATEVLAERLLRLAIAGAAALAEPDPALDEERAVIAEVRAAEATGALPVKPEADHRRHLAGLERSALQRPPSWEGSAPPPGAWCSCCSRHKPEAGGRWWRPRQPRTDALAAGPGWHCWACHPPPPRCAVREAAT